MAIIGIDLGATKIKAGIVSNNKIIKTIITSTKANRTKKEILNDLIEFIKKMFSKEIKGIGIGVPTIVSKQGVMYQTHNISSLNEVKLKEILQKEFSIPVAVENDANCFTLGEKRFGKGKPFNNMIGVTLGSGLGTGLIINNELYIGGKFGGAGEFGQIPFKDKALEDYCSGKFFIEKYNIQGEKLFQNAKSKQSLKIFKEFGTNLGQALAIMTNALAPEAIILGGSISKSNALFKESMLIELQKWSFKKVFESLTILFSDNPDISILGASSLTK